MKNIAIKVENLSKRYQIGKPKYNTIRNSVNNLFNKGFTTEFWALNDINFEINNGEAVGIIGKNGAGKSTLLKILSRITYPTKGRATIHGRVASLLEVGTGFHPELTGRENIFLNGSLLGMTKAEIKSNLNDIVTFSGVEQFIDTPVKHYSSGMRVRLAFSVAAHLDSEILIIDEVLSVGDYEFQQKCLEKMDSITKRNDKTLLFVSHDLRLIESLCTKAIVIENGKIIKHGNVEECVNAYKNSNIDLPSNLFKNDVLYLTSISVQKEIVEVFSDFKFKLILKNISRQSLDNIRIDIGINNNVNQRIGWLTNEMNKFTLNSMEEKSVDIKIFQWPFKPGKYSLTIYIENNNKKLLHIDHCVALNVVQKNVPYELTPPFGQGDLILNYSINYEA